MRVAVFGTGYVGLVTGACLAEVGNEVVCVDVDREKVDACAKGDVSIFEPGLTALVTENIAAGRLGFTDDPVPAIRGSTYIFIAVGSPSDVDGSADTTAVMQVADTIGENINEYKLVIDKSTVPVGTADKVQESIEERLRSRGEQIEYDVVSNPEFLKEGCAINDFMRPDRIVIGCDNDRAEKYMKTLYAPFNRNHEKVITMDVRSAELTKYAANAMLATRISLMNELAVLAESVGADIERVRRGIGSDSRIGYHYIYPGCGYGGSCLPKDVKALSRMADGADCHSRILDSVDAVNSDQKRLLFRKLSARFDGDLAGKTIAVWGLSFKPGTDDMREAPSRVLIDLVLESGGSVRAYDPEAMDVARELYDGVDGIEFVDSAADAVVQVDALVVMTEWKEFWAPDFGRLGDKMKQRIILDGRNIYDPDVLREYAIEYYAIGRL